MTINSLGLIRLGVAVPNIKLGNPAASGKQILAVIKSAEENHVSILTLPQLSLTGKSLGSSFYHQHLYDCQLNALDHILKSTQDSEMLIVLGGFVKVNSKNINCAFAMQGGKLLNIVPNTTPASEPWFLSPLEYKECNLPASIEILGQSVPLGVNIITDPVSQLKVGIALGEDWALGNSLSSFLVKQGAEIILNPTGHKALVEAYASRKTLILAEGTKLICAYAYTSLGAGESTGDGVYCGGSLISEIDSPITDGSPSALSSALYLGDVDFQNIRHKRGQSSFYNNAGASSLDSFSSLPCETINCQPLKLVESADCSLRHYSRTPFIPANNDLLAANCSKIFNIQTAALINRLLSTGLEKIIIGVSGGLDSTLALLVAVNVMTVLSRPLDNIIAITMPGFGTTDDTYKNALTMMDSLLVKTKEISIVDSVIKHFDDIEQDINVHDITYQNSQARERTQILMDIANKENGLVLGTGDLSEIALGWSTFNGDHMSMYNVNAGVPKTVIPYVINWVGTYQGFCEDKVALMETLQKIINTPISPELLPPDPDGNIAQKTEDTVGPYILHDFFIFYTIRYGMTPAKLFQVARVSFKDVYSPAFIKKWLISFYKRFFSQQFKRNCSPDGPQVGSVFLSPQAFVLAGDASYSAWVEEAEELSV